MALKASTKKITPPKKVSPATKKKVVVKAPTAPVKNVLTPIKTFTAPAMPSTTAPISSMSSSAAPVVKKASPDVNKNSNNGHRFHYFFWGLLFLLIGIVYLGNNLGAWQFDFNLQWAIVWPLALILIGLSLVSKRSRWLLIIGILGSAAFVALAVFCLVSFNSQSVSNYNNEEVVPPLNHIERPIAPTPSTSTSTDPIILDDLKANDVISNPLKISGHVDSSWFFEGVFPIKIVDENNKVLGTGQAQAGADWTLTNPVSFTATINFKKSTSTTGLLIFAKDNPSGLAENAEQFMLPVAFK